jgi:hypothetical protein
MRATPKREMESSRLPVAMEKMVTLKAHAMEKYAAQEDEEQLSLSIPRRHFLH